MKTNNGIAEAIRGILYVPDAVVRTHPAAPTSPQLNTVDRQRRTHRTLAHTSKFYYPLARARASNKGLYKPPFRRPYFCFFILTFLRVLALINARL